MDAVRGLWGCVQLLIGCFALWFTTSWEKSPEALKGAALGALFLVIGNTLLGVVDAVRARKFTSRGLLKFFEKVLVYFAVIISSYGIDCVFRSGEFAQTLILVMICLTEASSVFENSAALGFKWPSKLRDQFSRLESQLCKEGGYDEDKPGSLQDLRDSLGIEGSGKQEDNGQRSDVR